jgi:hypothetical protein
MLEEIPLGRELNAVIRTQAARPGENRRKVI